MPEGQLVRTQLVVLLVLLADLEAFIALEPAVWVPLTIIHHGRDRGLGCAHLAVLDPVHAQIERQGLKSSGPGSKSPHHTMECPASVG